MPGEFDAMLLRCTICGASNQLSASKLADALRCSRCRQVVPPPAHALPATDAEVAEITRDAPWPVLLDFWSPNEANARDSAPEVEKFARRHQGHVLVLRVNVAQAPQAKALFGVQRLPTYLLVDHGREVRRLVGLLSADQLEGVFRAA